MIISNRLRETESGAYGLRTLISLLGEERDPLFGVRSGRAIGLVRRSRAANIAAALSSRAFLLLLT